MLVAVAVDLLAGGELLAKQDQRFAIQRLQPDGCLACQRVLTADHQRQGFHQQWIAVDIGCVRLIKGNAHIQLVSQQLVFHLLLGDFTHVQRDVRIAAVKGFHQRPYEVGGEGGRDGNPQRPTAQITHVMDRTRAFLQCLRRA